MGSGDLGAWEPIGVAEVVGMFRLADFRWWLSGGRALEAHLGFEWRAHGDTDIGILRNDAPKLLDVLDRWDIHVGAAGVLTPWDGRPLEPDRFENNLWCRPPTDAAWALDVTLGDGNSQEWIYRRDTTVRRPWAEAVLTTAEDVPYLAPEVQLLFKSKSIRPKDDLDAETVIPALETSRRSWLAEHLDAAHPWQAIIARQTS